MAAPSQCQFELPELLQSGEAGFVEPGACGADTRQVIDDERGSEQAS